MFLPEAVYRKRNSKDLIIGFGGYNNRPVPQIGEFTSMKNMSGDNAPCASPRGPREFVQTLTGNANGLGSRDQLYWVDGTSFVYNGVVKGTVSDNEKTFLYFKNCILIWPDKKYYDPAADVFGNVENTYTSGTGQITFSTNKITTSGADFSGFSVGDGVTISGCTTNPGNNQTYIIKAVAAKELTFNDGTFTAGAESGVITIKRAVPDMDFIELYEGRMWGCKGNQIYASKSNDFKNWNVFSGLTTDSYSVSVVTEGDFTGIAATSTFLIFFKEDFIHKIFGFKPSNFELGQNKAPGVQKGSHKSIAVVNGIVYYKGVTAIYSYSGGNPNPESISFGTKQYTKAVAGSDERRYRVCLYDGNVYTLFVLDTWNNNTWHVEDNLNIINFTFFGNYMYGLGADKKIYKFYTANETFEGSEVVEWEGITGLIYESIGEKTGSSEINFIANLESGSELSIYMSQDNGPWELIGTYTASGFQAFTDVIKPDEAHHFQLKFVGKGKQMLYELERKFFYGSGV